MVRASLRHAAILTALRSRLLNCICYAATGESSQLLDDDVVLMPVFSTLLL